MTYPERGAYFNHQFTVIFVRLFALANISRASGYVIMFRVGPPTAKVFVDFALIGRTWLNQSMCSLHGGGEGYRPEVLGASPRPIVRIYHYRNTV